MRKHIFHQFYNEFTSRDEQNSHLTGLINVEGVHYRRPRVVIVDGEDDDDLIEGVNPNSASFYYKLRYHENEFRVTGLLFFIICKF